MINGRGNEAFLLTLSAPVALLRNNVPPVRFIKQDVDIPHETFFFSFNILHFLLKAIVFSYYYSECSMASTYRTYGFTCKCLLLLDRTLTYSFA